MQKRKLRVGFAFLNYGSNGGIASEHPDIRRWIVPTIIAAKLDDRIQDIITEDWTDTPVPMVRNDIAYWAVENGVDVLVMIDSDQAPDMYVGSDPTAKPFFQSSFDFIYENYDKGPRIVFAPYGGPPGHPTKGGYENPYVFHWESFHTGHMESSFKMAAYTRHEAALMSGISNADAGPTGLCMIDTRLFNLLPDPIYDYEYKDDKPPCPHCHQPVSGPRRKKDTTEDVYFFRNIALNGVARLGYNPVFCNWDSWAGHHKPWCVGKPHVMTSDMVGRHLRDAFENGSPNGVRKIHFREDPSTPRNPINVNGPIKIADAQPHAKNRVFVNRDAPVEDKIAALNGHEKVRCAEVGIEMPRYDGSDLGHVTPSDDLATLSALVAQESVKLRMQGQPMVIVELGSWTGKSALAMAAGVEPGHEYTLYCVDHWQGTGTDRMRLVAQQAGSDSVFETFMQNTAHNRKIVPLRGHTQDIAKQWLALSASRMAGVYHGSIDFLFIDAGHTYEECKADIEAWMPFVRPGGVICGHDFNYQWPGVVQAVNEVFQGQKFQVGGSIWVKRHGSGETSNGQVIHAEIAGQV